MSSFVVDLFVEDRAHEEFVGALIRRIARDQNREIELRVRAARGGHARVLAELELYQRAVLAGALNMRMPDLLVVATDTNCNGVNATKAAIRKELRREFVDRAIIAAPDPHIERWFLSDGHSFHDVVGVEPAREQRKCERDRYKRMLSNAVRKAGHPAILGGIEFATELADVMDLFRAGRAEPSLKQFVRDAVAAIKLGPS